MDGISSLESLRKRARRVALGSTTLPIAELSDIIKVRKLHAGLRIWRCCPFWRKHLRKRRVSRKEALEALKKESDPALRDQIRRLLAAPPEKRTNFLRKRVAFRASAL